MVANNGVVNVVWFFQKGEGGPVLGKGSHHEEAGPSSKHGACRVPFLDFAPLLLPRLVQGGHAGIAGEPGHEYI